MPTTRRRLDPTTRDYVLTLGEYEQDLGVTSKAFARVATKRGSVVPAPTFGSRLHTIKGPFPGYERLAERYVKEAIADMISAREIRDVVVDVDVVRSGSLGAGLGLEINFRDRRGRRQTVRHTHRLQGT